MLEGDLDPLAPAAAREQIEKDLEAAGTDCEMTIFEYVAHAFTLPFMGSDTSTCFAYIEDASKQLMQVIADILKGL